MKRGLTIGLMLLAAAGIIAAPPVKTKKKREKPVKHYIDIYAGGGVSGFGYTPVGGKSTIGGSFTLGAGYTWFFKPYMGLQTGLQFTRIASTASLTEPMEWTQLPDGSPLTDYIGEPYIHRAAFDGWKEKEQAYLLRIPVGLRFRYFKDRDSRAGLHAAAGLNLSFPVLSNYVHTTGAITHTGWYPQWQLELHDLPDRFETETFDGRQEESIGSKLHTVNAELYAELGTAVRINRKCELFITAYAQFMLNNFSSVAQDERTPLGFATAHNNYTFMQPYRGLIGTDKVGAMHPWNVGIKAGASIWPGKTDREKQRLLKKLAKQFPDVLPPNEIHDTIYLHDTIYVSDTIRTERIIRDTITIIEHQKAEQQLDSMLSEAVIWFRFDEYEPILEPAYILDSVADMMLRFPHLRIHVNGHACKLGSDAYNQRLAWKRAQAVAELLEEKGIPESRMIIYSFGNNIPYRYNSEKQLSKDRRVEIIPEGIQHHDKDRIIEGRIPQ